MSLRPDRSLLVQMRNFTRRMDRLLGKVIDHGACLHQNGIWKSTLFDETKAERFAWYAEQLISDLEGAAGRLRFMFEPKEMGKIGKDRVARDDKRYGELRKAMNGSTAGDAP